MSGLTRTDLTTERKVELAAASLALQGSRAVAQLAEAFGVSRPTVYEARAQGLKALVRQFDREVRAREMTRVPIVERQVERTMVGLRVAGNNSIRAIEVLLPIIYPGVEVSYGWIQEKLVEAERRAAEFNSAMDLSGIKAVALDEMFSQGKPVLAGIDLDSGFLVALDLCEGRSGEDWRRSLETAKAQGLDLEVVVKDAAKGIAAGVQAVFPEAEQRDDSFHAHYAMGKVLRHLEKKAYAAIAKEMAAEEAIESLKRSRSATREARRSLDSKLGHARRRCLQALELHDTFARAMTEVRDALEVIDLETGQLRTADDMEARLLSATDVMLELPDKRCHKVGRYLRNRAPGLVLYAGTFRRELVDLASRVGDEPVRLGCIILRLEHELKLRFTMGDDFERRRHLLGAAAVLRDQVGSDASEVFGAIRDIHHRRHRASSAVEGFNAALRPHLYVHKRATQGFLDLFRAYHNLKTRRWGRHQKTSAYGLVTGTPVVDWLSMLGYPPAQLTH